MSDSSDSGETLDLPIEFPTQYSVLSKVGRGGVGVVYKALDNLLQREVAIKLLLQAQKSEQSQSRFVRETRVLSSLDHPNIVKLYAADFNSQLPFIVMEWIDGQPLSEFVESGNVNTLSLKTIVEQLFSALDYSHSKGVVHRDISPANIIITENEIGQLQIKLLDFGLALNVADADVKITNTGQMLGNPSFMSPEQCKGEPASSSSDIYSTACVLFYCLTRKTPFEANSAMEQMYKHVNEDPNFSSLPAEWVQAGIVDVLKKGMAKNSAERYQSGSDFKLAFDKVLSRLGVCERKPVPVVLIALATSVLVGLVIASCIYFIRNYATLFPPPEEKKQSAAVAGEADRQYDWATREMSGKGLTPRATELFKQGAILYDKAIALAQNEIRSGKVASTGRLHNLIVRCAKQRATCFNYLQDFDLSAKEFERALEFTNALQSPDEERIDVLKYYAQMLLKSQKRERYIKLLIDMQKWNLSKNSFVRKYFADTKIALAKQFYFDRRFAESNKVLSESLATYTDLGLNDKPCGILSSSLMAQNFYALNEIEQCKKHLRLSEAFIYVPSQDDEDATVAAATINGRLEGILKNRKSAGALYQHGFDVAGMIASGHRDYVPLCNILEKYADYELSVGNYWKAEQLAQESAERVPHWERMDFIHPACCVVLAESCFLQEKDAECLKQIKKGRVIAGEAKLLAVLQGQILDFIEARLLARQAAENIDAKASQSKAMDLFEQTKTLAGNPLVLQEKFICDGFEDYAKLLDKAGKKVQAEQLRALLRLKR